MEVTCARFQPRLAGVLREEAELHTDQLQLGSIIPPLSSHSSLVSAHHRPFPFFRGVGAAVSRVGLSSRCGGRRRLRVP